MFTGIVEALGTVESIQREGRNVHLTIKAPFASELKIDQSISHNGACLTVVSLDEGTYTVTAIEETLQKTNLGDLEIGEEINLERCMKLGDRLDGHIVQGHVDQTGICEKVELMDGSWKFYFSYQSSLNNITVAKGSVCVNGVSLTVVDSDKSGFSVAIIPYTYQNTSFKNLKKGGRINLEFDVIGKYVARLMQLQ